MSAISASFMGLLPRLRSAFNGRQTQHQIARDIRRVTSQLEFICITVDVVSFNNEESMLYPAIGEAHKQHIMQIAIGAE